MILLSADFFIVAELLAVTLFSLFTEVTFFFWMPLLTKFPPIFHLALQFLFIGLPQCLIILLPQYIILFYFALGLSSLIGGIMSFLRFHYVKRKMIKLGNVVSKQAQLFDLEAGSLRSFSEAVSSYFSLKPIEFANRSNTISLYQTCIMMMTITAISAVDFKCFPSRFRKSKTYGVSLMDIGVALIITSSGLVMSKYLHGPSKIKLARLLQYSIPLFVFGIFKAILSASFNIGAEEYGKHWNFFLNLAILPFSLFIFNYLPSVHFVPIVCVAYLTIFQYFLSIHGFSDYIFTKSGENFYSLNKIGIYSLGGYISLFNLSCYVGKVYKNPSLGIKKSILILAPATIALWSLFATLYNVIPPSRPLANVTYVIWGVANGTLHISLFVVIDYIFPENYRFIIFAEMISEYRLYAFLLANVLSTLIRKVISIHSKSVLYTIKVVAAYITFTCLITGYFFYRKHRRLLLNTE